MKPMHQLNMNSLLGGGIKRKRKKEHLEEDMSKRPSYARFTLADPTEND